MLKNLSGLLRASVKLSAFSRSSPSPHSSQLSTKYLAASARSLSQAPSRFFQSQKDNENSAQEHSLEASSSSGSPQNLFRNEDLRVSPFISDFKVRIESKYPVVDKTAELYHLILHLRSVLVLGPRRFGKTTNILTLKSIFMNGYAWWEKYCSHFAIFKAGYKFPIHPVLHLDFSGKKNLKELRIDIVLTLVSTLKEYGLCDQNYLNRKEQFISGAHELFIPLFQEAIFKLSQLGSVVLLIDEYDSPVTEVVERLHGQSSNLQDLSPHPDVEELTYFYRQLFTQIKAFQATGTVHPHIKFFYLTGCVPLSRLGLFSGANDVFVTRKSHEFSKLIGYTREEILETFSNNLEDAVNILSAKKPVELPGGTPTELAPKGSQDEAQVINYKEKIMDQIAENYDGFVFNTSQKEPLYSPFAINRLFQDWADDATNISTYPAYYSASGSSTLLWRLAMSMPMILKTKLYWGLMDNKPYEIGLSSPADELQENQKLENLFGSATRLGYYSGLFSLNLEKSSRETWHFKITNREMREVYLCQLVSEFGYGENYVKMLGYLTFEDYYNYFELMTQEIKKLSVFDQIPGQGKHKLEVEAYGHTLFAFFHEKLKQFIKERNHIYPNVSLECIKDRAISTSKTRPDCIIIIDGLIEKPKIAKKEDQGSHGNKDGVKVKAEAEAEAEKLPSFKKICINAEFKCSEDIEKALKDAKQDLIFKKDNFKKLREIYSKLKDCDETIFVAGALGFGVPQALEFYVLRNENLELFGKWP